MKDLAPPSLVPALLATLSCFRQTGASGAVPHGAGVFSYCALTRERLATVRLRHPVLAVVLSGRKELWRGLACEVLSAGTLFALPAGVDLEIVNDPDPRSGIYQSFILEITPALRGDLVALAGAAPGAQAAIALSAELVEALSHAAAAIATGPAAEPVRRARIGELLALLAAEPGAGVLFALSTAERVAQLVRGRPDHAWCAQAVAGALGMSESTLRRRLRAEGGGFAAILRRERMRIARRMLEQGAASGAVLTAVGYASRAHFARAYRAEFGRNPARTPGSPGRNGLSRGRRVARDHDVFPA